MSIRTDIDEFKEAIDKGYISGNTVAIVRKNGKIFDYVLPHEEVRKDEVVTVESVVDVLEELDYIK
ncbi:competence regulator inhibitor paratox [Streptococcus agalactiae]|uniref:competence regulator inhibitor paratox n=2 Tax=Streptococcus agalactiae TaxID=1311 RepID=UPI00362C4C36